MSTIAFHPTDCCHWGIYEAATSIVWIGPTVFNDPARVRYVVLHELAHAWQYRTGHFPEIIKDFTPWGFAAIGPALEAGADCVAKLWGATGSHYWNCPPAAQAVAAKRLTGNWE